MVDVGTVDVEFGEVVCVVEVGAVVCVVDVGAVVVD